MNKKITVLLLKDAKNFIKNLPKEARDKVGKSIRKTQDRINGNWFKKLDGEIWEFRIVYKEHYIRVLAFWDGTQKEETLIVCTSGFFKKTNKTPDNEIVQAKQERKIYFEEKTK